MDSNNFIPREDDPASRAIQKMRDRRSSSGRATGDGSPLINFGSNFDVIDGAAASQGSGGNGGAGGNCCGGGGNTGGGGGGCCTPGGPTTGGLQTQVNDITDRMDDAEITAVCNSDGTITVTLTL